MDLYSINPLLQIDTAVETIGFYLTCSSFLKINLHLKSGEHFNFIHPRSEVSSVEQIQGMKLGNPTRRHRFTRPEGQVSGVRVKNDMLYPKIAFIPK